MPLPSLRKPVATTKHSVDTEPNVNQDALDFVREGPASNSVEPATRRSLLGEILDWLLGPLFLLWPMSVAITYVVALNISNTPYDTSLANALTILEQQLQLDGDLPRFNIPAVAKLALRAIDNDGVFWKVSTVNGDVLEGDAELPTPAPPTESSLNTIVYETKTLRDFEIRVAYKWVGTSTNSTKLVLLLVAEGTEKRTQLANDIIKGVIMPQFFVLPIAAILIWFGLSRGIAPVNALQRRLRARQLDDLSGIDGKSAPSEIVPLIDAINDLFKRLASNIATQRRFVADAAHQLKTPLAGLRMQAELALRDLDGRDVQVSLEQILAGTTRATRLVSQLLLMANAEDTQGLPRANLIDVVALAEARTLDWIDVARENQIDLGFEGHEHAMWVEGDALLLAEALNNLIDNALRYTPEGGIVTICVEDAEANVIIAVEDSGPGIDIEDRERVFDRFYRVLGNTADGSGLGLAIVREIVQKHAGSVRITSPRPSTASQSGTRFEIQLPQKSPLKETTVGTSPTI